MEGDANTFTVELPEMQKYKTLDIMWRLFFFLLWILLWVILFGNIGISREVGMTALGVVGVLTIGFSFYASRKQKALRPLINRRFAEEFNAHTGYEYPRGIDIMAVERTIAVRKDDGSVLLWGVKRLTGTVKVFPAGARP